MKRVAILIIFLIALCFNLSSQYLSLPESVEYDPYNNRYLVSNWGHGSIVQIDSTGTQSIWLSNVQCFAGLHRVDNILYVACREYGVKGFDLLTGENVLNVPIPGATNINDVVADNSGNLYVSYVTGNVIYKVDIASGQYWLFADNDLDYPNGMYFDEENNRLILVSFRMNSVIQQVSLADSTVSLIIDPDLHNLDGITRDNQGNYYISSWYTNSVYKYDENFLNPPEVFSTHYGDPADIYYDTINNVLAVPLFYAHQVDFVEISNIGIHENELTYLPEIELNNFPNPFNPSTTISFTLTTECTENTELVIYNLKGQKIKTFPINSSTDQPLNSVIWNGTDQSNRPVSSGIYYYKLNIPDSPIRKMVLLK